MLVSKDTPIVKMGRIGAPFGVRGWVHLHSYTEPSNNILLYKTLYVEKAKGVREGASSVKGATTIKGTSEGVADLKHWQLFTVLEARAQGKGFVAHLQGVETRDAAALLTRREVGILRESLPALEEDEYYWSDLIGLTVINEAGEMLGQVVGLLETGSNDVLQVRGMTGAAGTTGKADTTAASGTRTAGTAGATKEHLIPYIPGDYVLEVNLKTRMMRVSWDSEF